MTSIISTTTETIEVNTSDQEEMHTAMTTVVNEIVTAAEEAVIQKNGISSWVASTAASSVNNAVTFEDGEQQTFVEHIPDESPNSGANAPPPQHQQQLLQPTVAIEHHLDVTVDTNDAMTASMIARRITTEDEAKAALAERRRLARIEAERLAEMERQRQEAAERAEEQRIADEEETQRRLEEETLRLVEEQRKAEELRLTQAIQV